MWLCYVLPFCGQYLGKGDSSWKDIRQVIWKNYFWKYFNEIRKNLYILKWEDKIQIIHKYHYHLYIVVFVFMIHCSSCFSTVSKSTHALNMMSIEKMEGGSVKRQIDIKTTQTPMHEQKDILECFSSFNMCKILIDAHNMNFKWSKSDCLIQRFFLNWSGVVAFSFIIDPCRKQTLTLNSVNSKLVCISI